MNVRPHEGSPGCKSAQERRLIAGCAGPMIELALARERGREEDLGKRMGDLKDGYFRLAIRPTSSKISAPVGQERWAGKFSGRG